MDHAAEIGVKTVQLIGGEPTLDPDFGRLTRYALGIGLNVNVRTNLVHVTSEQWELFTRPGVSVGFSWYSADPAKHGEVTGSRASHARTRFHWAGSSRAHQGRRADVASRGQKQDR